MNLNLENYIKELLRNQSKNQVKDGVVMIRKKRRSSLRKKRWLKILGKFVSVLSFVEKHPLALMVFGKMIDWFLRVLIELSKR